MTDDSFVVVQIYFAYRKRNTPKVEHGHGIFVVLFLYAGRQFRRRDFCYD